MKKLSDIISTLQEYDGRPLRIMEVCGTHTSAIFKNGIRELISPQIKLISGPGCPVCVTGEGYIDRLVQYSLTENSTVLSFGDMMKVKGSSLSLSEAKAEGGSADIFYSPLSVLQRAKEHPDTRYIIAAVGFETTIPIYCLLLEALEKENIQNVRLLFSVKKILPALNFLCENENGIDAFLCPGHVSVVIGSNVYNSLAERFHKPFVISGFEGEHILLSVYEILRQLEKGEAAVRNFYPSVVTEDGNQTALRLIDKYFEPADEYWRGIGVLPLSGLKLKKTFKKYDAGSGLNEQTDKKENGCRCTDIILGRKSPPDCPLFGKACTPEHAVGPCMVSTEGACGIWYQNGKGNEK